MTESSLADALVRTIEDTPQVRRRYHFFIWTQGALQHLLPHQVAICGAYQRESRELRFEAFHNVAVAQPLLDLLCDPRGAVQQAAQAAWVARRGQALHLDLAQLGLPETVTQDHVGLDAEWRHWLVHGVARPQRATEIESFFLFASAHRVPSDTALACTELLLPHLHGAYLRMQRVERELNAVAAPPHERPNQVVAAGITSREKQVLRWVRDGRNNQQIGEALGISPLTVKNHIQKILRKLNATNRAQAVAKAMALNLLAASAVDPE